MQRIERVHKSAIATLCKFCDGVLFKTDREVAEWDYEYIYALYIYVYTRAHSIGGVKAAGQLVDDVYHIVQPAVGAMADRRTAVEEFLTHDEYRTEGTWSRWQAVATYLCNMIEKDCLVEEYGER